MSIHHFILSNAFSVTAGNLSENDQAFIFFMDYALPRRIKLWGRAEIIENVDTLMPDIRAHPCYAKVERVLRFTVEAWDENCRQHIPDLLRKIEDGG